MNTENGEFYWAMGTYRPAAVLSAGHPVRERPIRIACIYVRTGCPNPASMDGIRFFRMAEALSRRGFVGDQGVRLSTS